MGEAMSYAFLAGKYGAKILARWWSQVKERWLAYHVLLMSQPDQSEPGLKRTRVEASESVPALLPGTSTM
jgi:hypothetical protein